MLKFEYIDIAENSIKCLEKISMQYSENIFNETTIEFFLNIIDFFTL